MTEIFSSSLLENWDQISGIDILLCLALAFCIGLLIVFVYKKTATDMRYSSSFSASLIAVCMITAMAILALNDNIVVAVGLLAVLSVIRWRCVLHEPAEAALLFWAIAVGVVLANGLILLALIGSIAIGAIMILMVNSRTSGNLYTVEIRCTDQAAEIVATEYLRSHVACAQIKRKSAEEGLIELKYEVRLKDDNTDFVTALSEQQGVLSAILVGE